MSLTKPFFACVAVVMLSTSVSSAQIVKTVGDIQPRFKNGNVGGNGPVDDSMATMEPGVHSILYSGVISDFLTDSSMANNARPFIGFDQSEDNVNGPEDVIANFAYIDNILMTVDGATIWNENFEGATVGETSPVNGNLPGTVVQGANLLQLQAVNIPAEFTSGSGQGALLSTTAGGDGNGNRFAALRTAGQGENNFISFASVATSATYTLSFDLYIPDGSAMGLLGDFDNDGDVDIDDLDQYNGNIGAAATGELEALDLDDNGTVELADFQQHYQTLVETSNGGKGTAAGDVNLDGVVNVLGDAFALVGNLNNSATSWSQGDLNADGTVNVLGDAFLLVGNLGADNGGGGEAPSTSTVPEPGVMSLFGFAGICAVLQRRKQEPKDNTRIRRRGIYPRA